jgi:hypothetical protein
MAISGHKNEASIRSYSSNISEDRSHEMSNALTIVTADQRPIKEAEGLPERFLPLEDINLPSTPLLNSVMNTVVSPVLIKSVKRHIQIQQI